MPCDAGARRRPMIWPERGRATRHALEAPSAAPSGSGARRGARRRPKLRIAMPAQGSAMRRRPRLARREASSPRNARGSRRRWGFRGAVGACGPPPARTAFAGEIADNPQPLVAPAASAARHPLARGPPPPLRRG
jgi:hypothetical protein